MIAEALALDTDECWSEAELQRLHGEIRLAEGGAGDDIPAILDERDAAVIAASVSRLDEGERGRIRSRFLSFGTCSITDPIDDLRRLGLLPREPVERAPA